MTSEKVLLEMRRLIKQGWCKGSSARDENNRGCIATDPQAVSWCLEGALHKACAGDQQAYSSVDKTLTVVIGRERWGDWNDEQDSVAAVLKVIRKALDAKKT